MSGIKTKFEFSQIKSQILRVENQLSKLISDSKLDPRDIEMYLNKISFKESLVEATKEIDSLYENRQIELEIREILKISAKIVFEKSDKLNTEIEYLKSKGENALLDVYENINTAIKSQGSLNSVYKKYIVEEKERKITVLKEFIENSKAMFQHDNTLLFFNDLIAIEPSLQNHFDYATYLYESGLYDDSYSIYQTILSEYDKADSNDKKLLAPDIGVSYSNMGVIDRINENFTGAEEKYKTAINLFESLNDSSPAVKNAITTTTNNLAVLYDYQHNIDVALEMFRNVLDLYKELNTIEPDNFLPNISLAMNNIASILGKKGETEEAIIILKKSLEIRRNLSESKSDYFLPKVSITLNNLGNCYSQIDEFNLAEDCYSEALQILEKLSENSSKYNPELAITNLNIGTVNARSKKFDIAESSFKKALEYYNQFDGLYSREKLMVLSNYAGIYAEQEDFISAIKILEESIDIEQKLIDKAPQIFLSHYISTLQKTISYCLQTNDLIKVSKYYNELTEIESMHNDC